MPFAIEVNKSSSTIIIDLQAPFKPSEDMPQIHQRLSTLADMLERPIYRVYDFSNTELDFSTLVELLQQDTQNREGSATDWRFVPICVGSDAMSKQFSKSMEQEQYGGRGALLFRTREAARQHIQQAKLKRKQA